MAVSKTARGGSNPPRLAYVREAQWKRTGVLSQGMQVRVLSRIPGSQHHPHLSKGAAEKAGGLADLSEWLGRRLQIFVSWFESSGRLYGGRSIKAMRWFVEPVYEGSTPFDYPTETRT